MEEFAGEDEESNSEVSEEDDKESNSEAAKDLDPLPIYDNFYSPENGSFYSQSPYKTLDPTENSIRLLKKLPGEENGMLSFTLLENRPLDLVRSRYTALSYCAGDPRKNETILVNGLEFNAFANLGHALKQVVVYWEKHGKKAEGQLLWADQICINQSNRDERSHQVSQMRDIYAAAERVLISLSVEDSEESGAGVAPNAVVGVAWMNELRHQLQTMNCAGLEETFESPCWKLLLHHMTGSLLEPSFQTGVFGFFQLLRSPWWKRAWIYQEFIVASEAEFIYKGSSISWEDFAIVMCHLRDMEHGLPKALTKTTERWHEAVRAWEERKRTWQDLFDDEEAPSRSLYQLGRITAEEIILLKSVFILIQRKINWTGPTDLKVWLECSRTCQTSDPRDQVYAFLGLADPRYNIIPDYSPTNTLDDLLLEVAQKIVATENSLNLLYYVGVRSHLHRDLIVTWVPDWRTTRSVDNILDGFQEKLETFFEQALHIAPITPHGTVVKAQGIRVDTIPSGLLKSALRPSPKTFNTSRGLRVKWLWWTRFGPGDCLWCFPGSTFVFVLRPEGDHWLLLYTSSLIFPDSDHPVWASNVTKLILAGDFVGLLAVEGLGVEAIEIH